MRGKYVLDELLTDEDKILRDAARTWVESRLFPLRREMDEDWAEHELTDDLLKEMLIDLGFQKAFFPEEYDGAGMNSMVTGCVVLEELARGGLRSSSGDGLSDLGLHTADLCQLEERTLARVVVRIAM